MDTDKRKHLQDIYTTDRATRDDYTPQVSVDVIQDRKRELRRHQFISSMLGLIVLMLGIALVYVVVREYIQINELANETADPITDKYIPRYALPSQSEWVLDFADKSFGDPEWNGEGERPLNTEWLKKAAFNVILAEQALQTEEFDLAAEHYENALTILPDIQGVRVPLGMAYFKLERFEEALKMFEMAPDTDLTPSILNNLGAACIEADKLDKGEEYLKRALTLEPGYPEVLRNLATLYQKQERPADAIKAFEEYLDHRQADTDTRYTFALYLTKTANWELAGEQLRRLTEDITDVANLYLLLARVEIKLGNDKAAIEAFQRASQLSDPDLAIGWMNEAEFDSLRENQDFQALIKYTEQKR
jgi:tetratricopeptide (TPR) repeat protein